MGQVRVALGRALQIGQHLGSYDGSSHNIEQKSDPVDQPNGRMVRNGGSRASGPPQRSQDCDKGVLLIEPQPARGGFDDERAVGAGSGRL